MNPITIKARKFTQHLRVGAAAAFVALALTAPVQAQTLINVDFGVGTASLEDGDGGRRHGHE